MHDIFDAQDYFDQVLAYARQFTPPNKASKAVGRIKLAVQAGGEMPLFEALSLEQELTGRPVFERGRPRGSAVVRDQEYAAVQGRVSGRRAARG